MVFPGTGKRIGRIVGLRKLGGTMKNWAFTLVELLVVIAIIGVLAAMMLPAFSRARDSAKRAQCQSNLRQVAICYHLYSQDFRDRLPTRDQLGNSSYRVVVDPLGLPRF